MKSTATCKNLIKLAASSGLLLLSMNAAHAEGGLIKALDDAGVVVGGWANGGITYNATNPHDNYNGPVTFADRSAEFQLNQLNVFIQKAVATEGDKIDIGGRADVMFGTDAVFTQAYGTLSKGGSWDLGLLRSADNPFYGIAVPQLYAEVYLPVGNGLNVKVGHFYTPIGYETVPAPDNFFYTHAYTMQFGEPFTHTGFMANYALDANWSFMAGTVTGSETGGWDGNFDQQLGNWAGLFGATWTSTSKATSFNISGTYGETSETNSADWSMYSMVFKHDILPKLHLVLQHDHGFADQAATAGGIQDAEWYGINSYLFYDVKDDLKVGIRGEWFRDQNGARVYSSARSGGTCAPCVAGSYYQVTAGVTWKPLSWLSVRPNVRYDWVEDNGGFRTFDGGGRTNQFLFSTDATVSF